MKNVTGQFNSLFVPLVEAIIVNLLRHTSFQTSLTKKTSESYKAIDLFLGCADLLSFSHALVVFCIFMSILVL